MEKSIYSFWGKKPIFYKIACVITFLGRERYLRKKAAENLNLKNGDVVLDLACGTGLNFEFLQEFIGKDGKIIGFDYSKEMLFAAKKRAKENNWQNISFIQGDAAKLSLNYKVDGIISTLGISAISNHKEALKQAIRILKINKKIVILDAQLFSGIFSMFNPLIKFVYKHFANWDYEKNIKRDLEKLILTGKLKIERYNKGTIYILTGKK